MTITAGLIDGRDGGGLPFSHGAVQLASRAREVLRRALVAHRSIDAGAPGSACHATRENLNAYVRVALSIRDTTRVSAHLECCRRCTATYLELVDVAARPRPAGSRTARTILG